MNREAPLFRAGSRHHSALYDELYADWPRVERATVADGARPRVEVLWISPRTWEALAREQGYLFQEVEGWGEVGA